MVDRNKVKNFGYVSRMDNLQAAILNYRLKNLNNVIARRRKNVELYKKYLDLQKIFIPAEKKYQFNSYHTFVIQVDKRDELKNYLKKNNIATAIHYPVPIHLQPASKSLGYKEGDLPVTEKQAKEILSLPINQYLSESDLERIISKINDF